MQLFALWGLFGGLIIGTLIVEVLRYMKNPEPLSLRQAAGWTGVWVSLAALFAVSVFLMDGTNKGLEFVTGYIIEWSLSVDNLFVFLLIFQYFGVPGQYQQRVLFWGIIGSIVLRVIVIAGALTLLSYFSWLIYLFGALLIYLGVKLLREGDVEVEPDKNLVLRLFKRLMPVETTYESDRFFVRRRGLLVATALMPVMIVIATANVMFAMDSIPAILAITRDPFIVYTSNIFAMLGLRALFFLIEGIMALSRFLQVGLSIVLIFVGGKMLTAEFVHIPVAISLGVVVAVLAGSVLASVLFPAPKAELVASDEKKVEDRDEEPVG